MDIQCLICDYHGIMAPVESVPSFPMHRCPSCRLEFCYPMPADTRQYESAYQGDKQSLGQEAAEYEGRVNLSAKILQEDMSWPVVSSFLTSPQLAVLRDLKKRIPSGALVLDIGCGTGLFLMALRLRGYDPAGSDCSDTALRPAREAGFRVWADDLKGLASKQIAPQAVVLFEVIEHVPDPVGFLKQIREIFPAAYVYVSTPSPQRRQLIEHKPRESWDFPPHHVTRWTPSTLRLVFQKAGFTQAAVHLFPPPPGTFSGSGLGRLLPWIGLAQEQVAVSSGGRVAEDVIPRVRNAYKIHSLKKFFYRPFSWLAYWKGITDISMLGIGHPSSKGSLPCAS